MYRIVIAEDQSIAREALRLVLERSGYDIVGEARDGLEAMQLLRAQTPDLLVLALRLRRLNGIEVIRRAHRAYPGIKTLVFSDVTNAPMILQCAQAGASAFVSKTSEFSEFLLALKAVERGRTWFPHKTAQGADIEPSAMEDTGALKSLSQRELSVLIYLAGGSRVHEIADELALNERTISTYKSRLLKKLNVRSLVELVDFARRNQLAPAVQAPLAEVNAQNTGSERTARFADVNTLLDILPFSVSVRALDGSPVFANQDLRRRFKTLQVDEPLGIGLREQIRLFGADDHTAERIESAFKSAVAHETTYRIDVVGVLQGEPTISLHWGVPLPDSHGAVNAYLCGTVNINGPEEIMLEHQDAAAEALAAGALNAALLERHGDEVSPRIAEAMALLDSASGLHDGCGTLIDTHKKIGEQLQMAGRRLEYLRFLAMTAETVRWPNITRCDLRVVTRDVAKKMEVTTSLPSSQILTTFSGRGLRCVWLDEMRYARLLTALLHRAASKNGTTPINVEVHAVLRSGGMVDIELRIEGHDARPRRGPSDGTESRVAEPDLELELCRKMAHALRAELHAAERGTDGSVALVLRLPRGVPQS
ncbi:response regulator transcription factor [Paraburkholderia humisilvae]|uniref:Protein-glutamate methylesterase/protein-glutamine glutaminase n=1 Tax=Paraburkholderia humisilvae TaxID=627669 RepID=A0A6J5F269_9BURK|nr:response regulator transcription factor [Paraburkholderia humisilvae]CAB3771405.1 Protein-glutamate methylesterase/protein-glutamine glutaminase [Paraburkholderia humisilvae]